MLAAPGGDTVPTDPDLAFEPKWDGFRAIVFRSADRVVIQGRGGDDLAYAFPEVVDAIRRELPDRVVVDGELIVIQDGRLEFSVLGSRLRPRTDARTIQRLADQHPATLVVFDLLALGDDVFMDRPYAQRRDSLEALVSTEAAIRITPMTRDRTIAARWFEEFEGGGLDGLIVKDVDSTYQPGKRVMRKIKHRRTLDAVVAGWRPHAKEPDQVASLLLGLYDDEGRLHHIGAASGLSAALRRELTEDLRPLLLDGDAVHPWRDETSTARRPGGANRWNRGREQTWHALRPDRVAEVAYDQFEGDRLRHVAAWQRWRPDRSPQSCTYAQAPELEAIDVDAVLHGEF
jgi:ATP-dependent DNA ligase